MRSFITLFVLLAGCPASKPTPNEEPTPEPVSAARFSDASAAERAGALQNALGFGGVYAVFAQFQADADARSVNEDNEPNGCPALEELGTEPLRVRYTASDCTAPSGALYSGMLEATNPLRWDSVGEDPSGETKLVAEAFTIDDGFSPTVIDGFWSQSDITYGVDYTVAIDLTTTVQGQTWHLAGGLTTTFTDGVQRSTCDEGLVGEVGGLGTFGVACDVTDFGGEASAGFVELTGEDTLRVDMAFDADGCFPATIDGVAVEPICLEGAGDGGGGGGGEGPIDSDVFGSSGFGCAGDEVFIDAQTLKGEAAGVELYFAAVGNDVEMHALAPDAIWGDESYDGWSKALTTGGYESGVSSALDCNNFEIAQIAFMAYDADGEVIGCQVIGNEDEDAIDLSECPRL